MTAPFQSQYATKTDITTLAITAASAVRFGESAIEAQLRAASSVADSYLASQFTLPLQTAPQGWDMSLTRAVCDIAAYFLYCQFGFNPNAPQDALIKARYDMAIEWLTQIKNKQIFPQWVDSGSAPVGSDEGGPFVISSPPVGFGDRGIVAADNWAPTPGSGNSE